MKPHGRTKAIKKVAHPCRTADGLLKFDRYISYLQADAMRWTSDGPQRKYRQIGSSAGSEEKARILA
jgi:hypothetical protein